MDMEKIAFVVSNFSSMETARSVLRILIQENLATCGNIFATHTGIFPWNGEMQEKSENAVLFKTSLEKRDRLINRLRDLHPYELPCIIAIDAQSSADYAAWLRNPNGYMSSDKEE